MIGRRVRLARSGRQWKGCCPFHGEKTPSFYVYDDHYHCFGCGAHGDAISFVMQSQGAGFMEAVEQLAAEAGLEVPKPSPEAAEAERRRHDLTAVLEAANAAYQRRLHLPEGRAALDYLRGRGLTEETIRRFGLGWSGEGRGALIAELKREGIEPDLLAEAGLMRGDEDGGRVGELFFNRVMFPIRDRRGRVISFGGRILGDGQPKYLNGPETALFSKRRTLYGAGPGPRPRAAPQVVVVEGYMDVIALHQAGFAGAVAPLGTALTEEQLEELWRLTPGPGAVLRRRRRRRPRRRAQRRTRAAAAGAGPHAAHRRAAAGRGPGHAGAPAGDAPASRPCSTPPARWPRRCTTCCARPAASERRSSARRSAPGWRRRRGASRTARWPANTARALLDRYFAGPRQRGRPTAPGERSGQRSRRAGRRSAPASRGHRTAPRRLPSADARAERMRVLTAILLRHPNLLHDVEHAYAALALPPPLRSAAPGIAGLGARHRTSGRCA